jgi:23S rRNA pseudouridine1911/1915/1917 synthase
METIIVPEHEAGERLDAWLVMRFPEQSRNHFQKLIKAGGVTVNGKPGKANSVLKDGAEIVITEGSASISRRDDGREVPEARIAEETGDYLVIEKPAGLLVHPAPNQKTGTLVDFLLKHDPKIAGVGDSAERPGIVHRLDREASGLMVVARNKESFEDLKRQFKDHSIKKEYLALVCGKVVKDTDVIDKPIGRKKGLGRMSARNKPQEGDKEARSTYDVIERFPHATLVKIVTETGRMHQVRVHMKAVGHSLVGDTLYGSEWRSSPSLGKVPRLFLHAATLGFNDLAGEWQEYHSELPPDLAGFLESLKLRHAKR